MPTLYQDPNINTSQTQLPSFVLLPEAQYYRDAGYALQESGLQDQSSAVLQNAAQNVKVLQANLNSTLSQDAGTFAQLSSSQRAAAGASGLSTYSSSYLDVYHQAASNFTRDVSRAQAVTQTQQQQVLTAATLQSQAYLNSIAGVKVQNQIDDLTNLYRLPQ